MGAVDKADTDQGVLRAKNVGVNLLQLVPAQIVVTITGGAGKVGFCYTVLLKRRQDLLRIFLRNGIDTGKLLSQVSLSLPAQGSDPVTYL